MTAGSAEHANPMHFQIGQEVMIVGPSIIGDDTDMGGKFKIDMVWEYSEKGLLFSGKGLAWYPASSLKLVEEGHELKIGDRVRVIGPSVRECDNHRIGRVFEITQLPDKCKWLGAPVGMDCYSTGDVPMYPASSLALVEEELKVGDYVESISNEYLRDKIFRVEALKDECGEVLAGNIYFSPKSLRKLSPAEVQAHLAPPINTPQNQFNEKTEARLAVIESRQDSLEEYARENDKNLSAIVKRSFRHENWISRFAKVGARWEEEKADLEERIECMGQTIGKMQKSISFLEAYQRDEISVVYDSMKPRDESIRMTIQRQSGPELIMYDDPARCLSWARTVLDGMRSKEK
jgi:hypothetical protein